MATSIKPQPGAQEAFLSATADIAIYGGAAGGGKTYALLLEPLRNIGNPNFGALVLRRTTPEITNVGGLWTESEKLYSSLGAESRLSTLDWRFPSGAKVKFDHLEHEKSKHKYQGSQTPLICFDELTHFTEGQFWYMVSRNRSTCGVRPYIRCTCNPDVTSWVRDFISWWIDPVTGYPIRNRSGAVRWFARHAGEFRWASSREELVRDYPTSEPKSLTFIPATLEDNPALLAADPGYRANLLALPFVERERLLGGNWNVVDTDGAEWPAEYFTELWPDYWPTDFGVSAMAIDPSKGKATGDYAAIVFIGVSSGLMWVDCTLARMPAPQIAEVAVDMYLEHLPNGVVVEANANQDTLFETLITQEVEQRRIAPLPLYLFNHTSAERKERRIFRLGPYLRNKQFRFRPDSRGCKLLEAQLRSFPLKAEDIHDDGPDALEMAVRLLGQLSGTGYESHDEVLVA